MPHYEPGNYWMDGPLQVGFATSKKGTPYVYIAGKVTNSLQPDGTYIDVPCEPIERTIWLYLSDGAAAYTHEKLARVGFNGDFADPKIAPENMKDGVAVYCKHEEYPKDSGIFRDRWDLSGGGDGLTHEETNVDQQSKATAMWANYKRNASSPAPPAVAEGDNIPF